LLFACPLMHLLHGHGHHGRAASRREQGSAPSGPTDTESRP
jgi:hypothetical protein